MNSSFFNKSFTTSRLLQNGSKSSYIDNSDGIGHLRQAADTLTQLNNLQYGELWELFVSGDTDIEPTDKVTLDGDSYEVRGVRTEDFGSITYKRILIVKKKV